MSRRSRPPGLSSGGGWKRWESVMRSACVCIAIVTLAASSAWPQGNPIGAAALGARKTSIRGSPARRRTVLSRRSTAVRRHHRTAREGAWHIRHLQFASFLMEGTADPQISSSCGRLRPASSGPRLARTGRTSETSRYSLRLISLCAGAYCRRQRAWSGASLAASYS